MESFRPDEVKLIYPTKVKPSQRIKLETTLAVFEFALQFYDADTIEHHTSSKVILLDGDCKVLGVYTVSESSHTYDIVETKFILQAAILANARGVIMVENCTSGDVTPNEEVKHLKCEIKLAAYLFDIELVDFMLISGEDFYSFADNKIL